MIDQLDIIAAAVLIDNIVFQGVRKKGYFPGGAGLYAIAGASLFSENTLLVTGVGQDFSEKIGPWFDSNKLSRDGLRFATDLTPCNIIDYSDSNFRSEKPLLGIDHFRKCEPSVEDVKKVLGKARSLYIFRNSRSNFWKKLLALLENYDLKILWEIGLDACSFKNRNEIIELLKFVNGFSLNLEEAKLIFNTKNEDKIIQTLQNVTKEIVFLRAGIRGSYVITREKIHFIPSINVELVDDTGAGNAYSGAVLIGMAEGLSPEICGAMGTISSSETIKQFGPPNIGNIVLREKTQENLKQLISRIN